MITIVDYKAGNLTSVRLALKAIGVSAVVTNSPEKIAAADRIIFPGVGHFGAATGNLRGLGLIESLKQCAKNGVPFLGICLGAQIILDRSEEDGRAAGLGLIPGAARLFRPRFAGCKVPQMGWNSIVQQRSHPVFKDIPDGSEFYFIHSYYPAPMVADNVLAVTNYADVTFASAICQDNVVATQFHPEKSGRLGLQLLKNFAKWKI
jgi:glutamine amidotransferase